MAWPLAGLCSPCALSGPPMTRGSLRENGPHKYCSLSQTAYSQHPSASFLIRENQQSRDLLFTCESQTLILCTRMRTHAHVCLFVGVCAREKWRQWGDGRGRSLGRLKKSQYTTLHWHVSPLLLLRHSELCLRGTWVDLGEG